MPEAAMVLPGPVVSLCRSIQKAGGETWLVGGCVRDHLLGRVPKDLDLEVHKLPAPALKKVLKRAGHVKAVGRSFGVFKLRLGDLELDVGLPQTAPSVTPSGEPVAVQGDPWISLPESARRRDLTINAIAYDPLSGSYADPYGGRDDLAAGLLQAVSAQTFVDDPLRVLRVMQFAARFEFTVAEELITLCRQTPIDDLPAERVWIEVEKLLLKPTRPSLGLVVAQQLEIFSRLMPGLAAVNDAALGAALDAAARMRDSTYLDTGRRAALMLSVLLHRCPESAEGILDQLKVFKLAGYPLRARVLHTTAVWSKLCNPITDSALRWLAEAGEIALIAQTAQAASDAPSVEAAWQRARQLDIEYRPTEALIKGRDLRPLGIPPGPHMGKILRRVRVEQLNGVIHTREDAISLVERLWSSRDF